MIASIVGVGMAVGGTLVGSGVGVDSMTGISAAVQAVRRIEKMMMKFFIQGNYMSLRAAVCEAVSPKQSPYW
jgi:F0F1-type ATP synthase membrane subunit c/vacuolar-type H+-ATPase subunit K